MTCKHTNGTGSTLSLDFIPQSPDMPYKQWTCSCSACGRHTEPCLTEREAQLRGMVGRWAELPITCAACRFSRIETRKGERVLYCYERGYGMPTEADYNCPKAVRRDT